MRVSTTLSLIPIAAAVAIISAQAAPPQGEATKAQAPVADLPGITTEDRLPNGCVSCHIKLPDGKDMRLNAVMKGVEGHPPLTSIKTVPTDCKVCHKQGGMAPGFNTLLHKVHFEKKAESHFVQMFQGNCLTCHSMELKTGKMTVKTGPKNW